MAHETFRHLDCASLYQNEKEVGQAIKEAMKDFNISRNELFITSKVSINDVIPKREEGGHLDIIEQGLNSFTYGLGTIF